MCDQKLSKSGALEISSFMKNISEFCMFKSKKLENVIQQYVFFIHICLRPFLAALDDLKTEFFKFFSWALFRQNHRDRDLE